ncbi:hypothetical protein BY458DRAFT_502232 [Sporodiniella umbellata]|nr:hypothetical protein BY458DRAFT_502232 [Sporodiniella umbellata]
MYFRGKEGSDKETDLLLSVIEDIQQNISDSLQKHESLMKAQKKEIYSVFDRDDMKIKPYTLRATFHHDGKSGTGHYWAYIWVEEVGGNLLDVSSEGGWFKFCDAQVTPAKEEDLFNDPIPPFSLMYIDESLPKFTKAQIYKQLPEELKEFVRKDNEMFEQELHSYSQPFSTSYPVYDEQWTTEKTEEYQIEQATFDDSNSTGTAVGQANTEAETPKFMGNGYTKLKEQANRKILDVSSYSCDDYRILMSFEVFLAKTQNQQGLEHLYLLYLSGPDENGNQTVNEMGSRYDEYLKFAWDQYQYLQNLGQKVSRALCHFVRREHQLALRAFLEVKRTEVSWKTQIMLNLDLHAYSSIDVISFRPLCELYGKKCLEILNRQAFNKALNISYRSRGLEDALRIAHQAHAMIGPDAISTDDTYASMRELWLSFGEQGNNDKLTSIQTDLLNTLVMTYLEGQSGQSVDPMDKTEVPNADIDEKPEEMSPWMYYKQICEEAKEALSKVEL